MRIIAGTAGGIPIAVPKQDVRPTTDRVREAVFSSLGSRVESASVLDLFAGSGALGLEALSRGARQAVFVEAKPAHCEIIRANLRKARLDDGKVICQDVLSFLKHPPPLPFDLIFLDPPYCKTKGDTNWAAQTLGHPALGRFLGEDGLIIAELPAHGPSQALPAPWITVNSRRYGDTNILYLRAPSDHEKELADATPT